jgi:hypothetical protein
MCIACLKLTIFANAYEIELTLTYEFGCKFWKWSWVGRIFLSLWFVTYDMVYLILHVCWNMQTYIYVNVSVGYIQDDSRSNGFYQCDDPWTLELIDSM